MSARGDLRPGEAYTFGGVTAGGGGSFSELEF